MMAAAWFAAVMVSAAQGGVVVTGEPLPADVVIVAIGDVPNTSWLPENLGRVRSRWLEADAMGRTNDPKVFAVGDVVKPGLLTAAIGQGRVAALALNVGHLASVRAELGRASDAAALADEWRAARADAPGAQHIGTDARMRAGIGRHTYLLAVMRPLVGELGLA